MYMGVDIGGSKTLVAALTDSGVIKEQLRFLTPGDYDSFVAEFSRAADALKHHDFHAAGIGAPGRINRDHGVYLAGGNLHWQNAPLQADVERLIHCPTVVDNDANLAGLSEAMLLPQYERVLYVTVSTGIGTGVIYKRTIDPAFADSEGGQMLLEYRGKLLPWEKFASGRAIAERYGKPAHDITDEATWRHIVRTLVIGFVELIAVTQPEVIVIGGSIGTYFERYEHLLADELKKYETPMVRIPKLRQAARPEEAVVYGCYDLAKQTYGQHH